MKRIIKRQNKRRIVLKVLYTPCKISLKAYLFWEAETMRAKIINNTNHNSSIDRQIYQN